MSQAMRLAVAIATRGRAAVLAHTLPDLAAQSRRADRVVVCHTVPADIAGLDSSLAEFMTGGPGTTLQRNQLIDELQDCDVILFVDDDLVMHRDYIAATVAAFQQDPSIAVTTGTMAADGAKGPGLTHADARRIADAATPGGDGAPQPAFNGYGCNMAMRRSVIREHHLRFDERLVMYAWYEDIDFTRRCGQYGRIVRLPGAVAVHMGTKLGRDSGRQLGYAQVVNPVYLCRKGSYLWSHAFRSIGRHLLINTARSPMPEPYVDRWGRLRGNIRALLDLSRGHVDPERVRLL